MADVSKKIGCSGVLLGIALFWAAVSWFLY